MKYVLVFVLLTCVLSASIKERMETAAAEGVQENTFLGDDEPITDEKVCNAIIDRYWVCFSDGSHCHCGFW